MSEYQKYLDCEHIWFPKTNWDVAPQTCNRCGIDVLDWKWVQKIAPIEAQRDEAVAACKHLANVVDSYASGTDDIVDALNETRDVIANLTNDQNCERM